MPYKRMNFPPQHTSKKRQGTICRNIREMRNSSICPNFPLSHMSLWPVKAWRSSTCDMWIVTENKLRYQNQMPSI